MSEPCRFLSHVTQSSGGKVKDSRNLLNETSAKKAWKYLGREITAMSTKLCLLWK